MNWKSPDGGEIGVYLAGRDDEQGGAGDGVVIDGRLAFAGGEDKFESIDGLIQYHMSGFLMHGVEYQY